MVKRCGCCLGMSGHPHLCRFFRGRIGLGWVASGGFIRSEIEFHPVEASVLKGRNGGFIWLKLQIKPLSLPVQAGGRMFGQAQARILTAGNRTCLCRKITIVRKNGR